MEELAEWPLSLVSAPTGYGKTTLLASWAASTHRQVAWASVGSRDLDTDGFWALVAAALEHAEPRLRFGRRSSRSVDDQDNQVAMALELLSRDVTLVLDGYERATQAGVDPAFSQLLDLAPETLHVVISTRREPDLALPLRRARGTVAELAARDLRLDDSETAAVLGRALGSGADVDAAAFAERTEGWPAAAHLGAYAARTATRPTEALERFSGAQPEVSDYLRLELLDAQPDDLRSFLLDTSVLERLTGPLCDALLHRQDSESKLRALARGGAFLVPRDEARHEYGVVRPVAEFLRAELLRSGPDRIAELHRRATAACERAGRFGEAARHADAAAGADETREFLSRHALELVRDGHVEYLESLLSTRVGAAVAHRRPALGAELRRLGRSGCDVPALAKAAERVAVLSAVLPSGPVRALVRSTAQAAQAYAFLLAGSIAEAYEAGAAAYAAADPDAAAPAGQAAAVASLAASRLGLGAAAAPLARASAAALARRGVRSGNAVALAELAQACVAEDRGDTGSAERLCAHAAELTGEPHTRTLALLQLARLRSPTPAAARAVLDKAGTELARCRGAGLLETLLAETEAKLQSRERAQEAPGELSAAERRVLRLLTTSLTQREIAHELYVSLNTIKTHARVIYRKLGVSSRSAAVVSARELNLV
jgi:LuxR family maltose regulon positive regulatory protein